MTLSPALNSCRKRAGALACCVFLALTLIIALNVGFVRNVSPSLPKGLFIVLYHLRAAKGCCTTISMPDIAPVPVLKMVAGGEGDIMAYGRDGALYVGGARIGIPRAMTEKGERRTPVKAGIIPHGMVFLAGTHERSFDSRYEEFGLVPLKDCKGRAFPCF